MTIAKSSFDKNTPMGFAFDKNTPMGNKLAADEPGAEQPTLSALEGLVNPLNTNEADKQASTDS